MWHGFDSLPFFLQYSQLKTTDGRIWVTLSKWRVTEQMLTLTYSSRPLSLLLWPGTQPHQRAPRLLGPPVLQLWGGASHILLSYLRIAEDVIYFLFHSVGFVFAYCWEANRGGVLLWWVFLMYTPHFIALYNASPLFPLDFGYSIFPLHLLSPSYPPPFLSYTNTLDFGLLIWTYPFKDIRVFYFILY